MHVGRSALVTPSSGICGSMPARFQALTNGNVTPTVPLAAMRRWFNVPAPEKHESDVSVDAARDVGPEVRW